MSNRGEMWVHGSSVVIQYPGGSGEEFTDRRRMQKVTDPTTGRTVPWSDLLGLRMGRHAVFRGQANNSNWFHFSIPTPAVTPDVTASDHVGITIARVSVYFSTPGPLIVIQALVISDGVTSRSVRRIMTSSNLHDPHLDRFEDGINSFLIEDGPIVLSPPPGPHGALVSVEVRFDVEGDVSFGSAGIHYHMG